MGMKRAVALAFALGAGVAAVVVATVAFLSWHASRPKAWNATAITATFESIDTEGPEKKLLFYYILQNNTDSDFRINSDADVVLVGRLERQQSLTGESSKEMLAGEFPLFLPARQRVRLGIHLGYSYAGTELLSGGATKTARERDQALAAYVRTELPNLSGFAIFHDDTRYQIDLPSGWK
jgi:hypothetical protein